MNNVEESRGEDKLMMWNDVHRVFVSFECALWILMAEQIMTGNLAGKKHGS